MPWTACRVPGDPGVSMFCLGQCDSATIGILSHSQALLPSATLFMCVRGNRAAWAISPESWSTSLCIGKSAVFPENKTENNTLPAPPPPQKICLWFAWFAEHFIYLRPNASLLLTNWHYWQDLASASRGSLKLWSWKNWASGVKFCPYFCTCRHKTESAHTTKTQSVKGGREWKVEQRKAERTCWGFSLSSSEPGDAAHVSGTVCIFLILRSIEKNKSKKIN